MHLIPFASAEHLRHLSDHSDHPHPAPLLTFPALVAVKSDRDIFLNLCVNSTCSEVGGVQEGLLKTNVLLPLKNKEEQHFAICNNMDGRGGHEGEGNRSEKD